MEFSLDQFYEYWNQFLDSKLINKIYLIDIFELGETLNAIKSQQKGLSLAVEDPSFRDGGNSIDNLNTTITGAIVVLSKIDIRKDKNAERRLALSQSLNAINTIKKQMLKDSVDQPCLRNLQYRTIETDKIGPLGDSLYGWRMQFDILNSFSYDQ